MPLYRRLPKRGFKSLNKKNTAILNLSKIQNIIDKSKNNIQKILDLKILKEKNIKEVYFDRGEYKYHGRVKTFAETLRKNGLKF